MCVLRGRKPLLLDDLAAPRCSCRAVVGDAAFLVGDDDLHAVAPGSSAPARLLVLVAIGRVESLTTVSGLVPAMPRTICSMSWMYVLVAQHVHRPAPAWSWWPVIAVVLFSRMMKVMSWPALIGVGDGDLAGVEEGAVAHEDDLLVGDERVDAAAGAAAQAHAASSCA